MLMISNLILIKFLNYHLNYGLLHILSNLMQEQ